MDPLLVSVSRHQLLPAVWMFIRGYFHTEGLLWFGIQTAVSFFCSILLTSSLNCSLARFALALLSHTWFGTIFLEAFQSQLIRMLHGLEEVHFYS